MLMDSKEILKAIDPKAAEIEKLRADMAILEHKNEKLRAEVKTNARHDLERKWMRQHGIMLETTEGMKYLKDEEFDKFFKRLKIKGSMFGSAPIKGQGQAVKYDDEFYDYELLDEEK